MTSEQRIADVISAAVIATDAGVGHRGAVVDQQANDPADHVASPTTTNIAYHRRCIRLSANCYQTLHNCAEAIHEWYQHRFETL
jgi:hypothetical protein